MLILLSPSKKLQKNSIKHPQNTSLDFAQEAQELVQVLKQKSRSELAALMNLSPALRDLNYERYTRWQYPFENQEEATTALLMFQGDVYKGMAAENFSEEDLQYAQTHLRILSGLYGVIKPLDLLLPYRLDMGTKLEINDAKNLYQYWDKKIQENIGECLQSHENRTIINLASHEYFKSVNPRTFDLPVVTPVFKELKNGRLKVISIYAKRARGIMTSYIIKNKIEKPEDLRHFDLDGYIFNEHLSDENTLLFTR